MMHMMVNEAAKWKTTDPQNPSSMRKYRKKDASHQSLWYGETQRTSASFEEPRERLDRVYENYYNYSLDHDAEDATGHVPAHPARYESITVGPINFPPRPHLSLPVALNSIFARQKPLRTAQNTHIYMFDRSDEHEHGICCIMLI
jgi:hypothetical protein